MSVGAISIDWGRLSAHDPEIAQATVASMWEEAVEPPPDPAYMGDPFTIGRCILPEGMTMAVATHLSDIYIPEVRLSLIQLMQYGGLDTVSVSQTSIQNLWKIEELRRQELVQWLRSLSSVGGNDAYDILYRVYRKHPDDAVSGAARENLCNLHMRNLSDPSDGNVSALQMRRRMEFLDTYPLLRLPPPTC